MDKIAKALKKLNGEERKIIKTILLKIKTADFENLDIKKLRGRADIFRVRKGKIRIIYRRADSGIFIIAIERRSDNTYK